MVHSLHCYYTAKILVKQQIWISVKTLFKWTNLFRITILSSGLIYFWEIYGDSNSSSFLKLGCPSFAQLQLNKKREKYFAKSFGRFTWLQAISKTVLDVSVEDTDNGILYPFIKEISISTTWTLTLCVSCWEDKRNVINIPELAKTGFCPTKNNNSLIMPKSTQATKQWEIMYRYLLSWIYFSKSILRSSNCELVRKNFFGGNWGNLKLEYSACNCSCRLSSCLKRAVQWKNPSICMLKPFKIIQT